MSPDRHPGPRRGTGRPRRRDRALGRRLGGLAALSLALAGCGREAAPPAPPTAAAPGPSPDGEVAVTGQVSVEVRGGARAALAGADVMFVADEAMRRFLAVRVEEASAGLRGLRAERERLQAELRRLVAETDRTNQAWKRSNDGELRRRLEVAVRPPRAAAGVDAIHRELLAEKRAAWDRATAAARRSDQVDRELAALQARAGRYREGPYFLQGLPPATRAAVTGPDGGFEVRLPPGRYAVVATGERRQGIASETHVWMIAADVEPGRATRLTLDGANQHGSDCAGCLVAVKTLPPWPARGAETP